MKLLILILCFCSVSAFAEILQIGDSQSQGVFGKTWFGKMKKLTDQEVNVLARGGGSVANWFDYSKLKGNFRKYHNDGRVLDISAIKMPELKTIFTYRKPDTIIIQLGGNMVRNSDESVKNSVAKMISLVREHLANCIWIGPPNGHARPQPRFGEFYKVLKESVEKDSCVFIDSRPHTSYPSGKGDGIHFDSLGAAGRKLVGIWVDGIGKEIFPSL